MKDKITILSTDDWQAIYFEGKLYQQGHSIDLQSLLIDLGYKVESKWIADEDMNDSSFPKDLKDFKYE